MLARIRDRPASTRGRLRIYLGMAPGVGKTFKALEEAHRRQERGTDIVVGFVEAHGRPRTSALLEGLEVLGRLRMEYRGVSIEEMDTDAVIARHPQVAVIDELAHSNAPGSPREKRWEDVELIRDAGIDVISTCNVQHLESVADAVATITGAPVNERLPDTILESADEIELVDMSPQALRRRIRHGNVYPPERARLALDRFFTEPNLSALRELALRRVARQVDEQLEDLVGERGLDRLPSVTERVLVVVDERAVTRRALRRAALLASALRASLAAIVIDLPTNAGASSIRARGLQENVDLATDLGAEIVRFEAKDMASGVEHVTRSRRITHLVLAHTPRGGLDRWLRPTLVESLVDRLPGIEVHVVGPGEEPPDHG